MNIIYLGSVALQGNKTGDLVITEELLMQTITEALALDLPAGWTPIEWLMKHISANASAFGWPKGKRASRFGAVGSIYTADTATVDPDGKLRTMGAVNWLTFAGHQPEAQVIRDVVTGYRGRAQTFDQHERKLKQEAKAGANSAITEAIKVLQMAYQGNAIQDRMAFKLWVFDQISKR